MPLRAQLNGKDIFSFEFTMDKWDEFKKYYRKQTVTMPCCNAKAIPKTSNRGTQFFSHHVRDNCDYKNESAEHIHIKTIIAKTALSLGWTVKTEYPGVSSSGEKWIADVYCEKNDEKRIFEIQLSKQKIETTIQRQHHYFDSNIKSIWFGSNEHHNHNITGSCYSLPYFLIDKFTIPDTPRVEGIELPISDFICDILNGHLKWSPLSLSYELLLIELPCPRCKKSHKIICGFTDNDKTVIPRSSRETNFISDFRKLQDISNLQLLNINPITLSLNFRKPNEPAVFCYMCISCDLWITYDDLFKHIRTNGLESQVEILEQKIQRLYIGKWRLKRS
jgi:hypothetical protein